MNKNFNILKQLISEPPSSWLKETGEELANKNARRNARLVALRVLSILDEQNMTQTELAAKMGVSRQQVTKIVKGEENFTFETIEKLEKALETTLMTIVVPQSESSRSKVNLKGATSFLPSQIFQYEAGLLAGGTFISKGINISGNIADLDKYVRGISFATKKNSNPDLIHFTSLTGSEIIKLAGESTYVQGFNKEGQIV